MLNRFEKNALDSWDQAGAGCGPGPDWVGGEMGLARPDLAQAWARSGLDLFLLVQIKSENVLFEPEYTDTGSVFSGAKCTA